MARDGANDNLRSEEQDWIDRTTALAMLCRSPRQLRRYVRARRIRTRRSVDGSLEYARTDVEHLLDSVDIRATSDTPGRTVTPATSDTSDEGKDRAVTLLIEDDRRVPLNLSDVQRLPVLALIASVRELQHTLTEAGIREADLRAQLAQREREHDTQQLTLEIHQIRRQRDQIGLALIAVLLLLVLAVAALLILAFLGWRIVVRLGA